MHVKCNTKSKKGISPSHISESGTSALLLSLIAKPIIFLEHLCLTTSTLCMKNFISKTHLPLSFTALFTLLALGLSAQMEVTDASTAPFTPENLISNIFLGDGVEVLNVSYEGDPQAVGFFKNAGNVIGIDRGILLTSGRAASVNCGGGPLGADCTGDQFASNDMAGTVSDTDLSDIANGPPLDVAKYTITFTPTADTLRFKYVFASEEYPEFSCDIFNDVFGFFISGPGINGPYSNNGANIATIPGTSTPVSIDNIHPDDGPGCPGENDQFYNNNDGFALQPVYDGYLDVFVAEAVVIPCETYTIKLLISDVSDNFFDSGVFLEAKSFGTGTLQVEATTVSLDGTITEGCSNGSFTFTLANEAEDDYPLDYTIIGDAINGVDYLPVSPDLFIPSGENSITIDIIGIEDGLPEGLESIGIDIQRDICNRDTFWMFIRENSIVPPQLQADTLVCAGDSVALDGTLPLPLPEPPSFSNFQDYGFDSSEPVYSPILVAGVQPTTLGEGVIQSVCVNIQHKWVDDIDLFLVSPGGQFIELSSDNGANCDNYTDICFSPSANTPINYLDPWPTCSAGEEPPFAGGTYQPEGIWSDLWDGEYPTNGTWQLLVIDDQNGFNGTILDWTITFEPLYQVAYQWQPADGLSCADCPDPMAAPTETTTYFLTATDNYGCQVFDTVAIAVSEFLPAPIINCVSTSSNSITFAWEEVPGATGYQVSINGGAWQMPNNGPLSQLVNGLNLSETITIEVRAIGSCDGAIGTAACSTPDCVSPQLSIGNIGHASCFGSADGSINVSASGGTGNYVFSINGANSNASGNFPALPAGIYEVSVTDDSGCPNSISVTIEQPDSLVISASISGHLSCFGANDGSATASATGGTPPFNFIWENGETGAMATSLGPGTQAVQVMDAQGCSGTASFEITEPALLTATVETDSVTCFGTSTGSATATVQGGTEPYFFDWGSAGAGTASDQIFGVAAGTYSLYVADANGCSSTVGFDIFEPEKIATEMAATDPACAGANTGTAMVNASGGSAPFAFAWSNGDTGATADSLAAATYQVVVTDANGCTALDSISLSSPPPLVVSLAANDASCFGEASGSVFSTVGGGSPPYSFLWDSGSTSPDLTMAPAGQHCLSVLDANGCESNSCATVSEPPEIILSATSSTADCGNMDGEIDLSVAGGAAPFLFDWNNGQTTEDLSGLGAGSFEVVVTDSNGCTAGLSETIVQTGVISFDFTKVDVLCAGENTGSVALEARGGSGSYSFSWTGPDNFSSSQKDLSELAAGSYSLTAEDGNGCSAVLELVIEEPTMLSASFAVEDASCPGFMDGSISLEPEGGSPPYSFSFDGAGFTANPVKIALATGFYDARLKDRNGCEFSIPDIFVGEPEPFGIELGNDRIFRYGDTIHLAPELTNIEPTEFGNYTWQWSSSNPLVPPLNPVSRLSGFFVTGQTTVTLVATSKAGGCVHVDRVNIFVTTEREVLVPTGFTPGNGGPAINNLLHVHGKSRLVEKVKAFRVFDRWGELLFEAFDFGINDPDIGWDGTFKGQDMPPGVYIWQAEVVYIDGVTERYKGETTLVR